MTVRSAIAETGDPAPSDAVLPDDPQLIGRRAATGAAWVVLAVIVGRILGLATNLILARLLEPDDFGLVGFAMIVISAFVVLQDLGVPASIVYSQRDIREIGATALTINVAAATILFGLTIIIAPFLARLSGDGAISSVVVVLALGLVVSSMGSVQRALLDKHLAFRRKFVPEIVPLIGSGAVSVVLAILGFGAWSLVGGYLAKSALSTGLLWSLSAVRPLPGFQWSAARELFGYGKHVSLTAIVGFVGINADYFIVGHVLGTYELGLYVLAFTISNLPCTIIGQVVSTVMFPAYAQIRDDRETVLRLFEDVFTFVSVLAVPAAIAIYVAGPAYIPVVFGEKWTGIGRPLQVLAIYGVLRTIGLGFAPVYKAIGHPGVNWRLNIVRIAILIPLMLYLVRYGLIGIAIAYVIVATAFVPMNAVRMGHLLEMSAGWFFRLAAPQILAVSVAAGVILVWDLLQPHEGDGIGLASATMLTIVAAAAYISIVVMSNPRALKLARTSVHHLWLARRRFAT